MQAKTSSSTTKKTCEFLLAIIAWFSILFQLYLTTDTVANFLSYFTILSNILIGISMAFLAVAPSSKPGKYFSLPSVQTAVAVYIFIVGLVYNTILRGIWAPTGAQFIVDNLLHVFVPLLYMLYWLFFTQKGILHWKNGITWTYFPFIYLIYTLIRGHFTNWYPYPFMNVAKFGYMQVAINVVFMIIAFFVVGLLLIAFNRFSGKRQSF